MESNISQSEETALPSSGRILAIDLGEKRIGTALCDPRQRFAKAHAVLKRRSRKEDFARISNIVVEQKIVFVVMGLPLPLGGGESETTRWVRHYSADLAGNLTVPLVLWDESFSTRQAQELLRERGVKHWRKRREQVDAVAAAFILQSYLDAREANQEAASDDESL